MAGKVSCDRSGVLRQVRTSTARADFQPLLLSWSVGLSGDGLDRITSGWGWWTVDGGRAHKRGGAGMWVGDAGEVTCDKARADFQSHATTR